MVFASGHKGGQLAVGPGMVSSAFSCRGTTYRLPDASARHLMHTCSAIIPSSLMKGKHMPLESVRKSKGWQEASVREEVS